MISPSLQILREGNWLVVFFKEPQKVLSWAIQEGGVRATQVVAWYEVERGDLAPPVDPREFLKVKLLERGFVDAVGLLTSADLDAYVDTTRSAEDLSARCIATVGLGNALRVGDPPREQSIGTINLLCHLSAPLTEAAQLEALSIAVEARSLAVREAGVPSIQSELPATGTGTDCVVMAAPLLGDPIHYTGKHTLAGHLLGASVLEAVQQGISQFKSALRR